MKLYSIILALAACAVAAPVITVSNQSLRITDANHDSIKALAVKVINAETKAKEKADSAEHTLHYARLGVVSAKGLEKIEDAEHYAKLAREAADAAIAASDRAAAATQEMAEISKANPSPSSSDAVARALAAADRANQAKTRAIRASKQTRNLLEERKRIESLSKSGSSFENWAIMIPMMYALNRAWHGKPLIPSSAPRASAAPATPAATPEAPAADPVTRDAAKSGDFNKLKIVAAATTISAVIAWLSSKTAEFCISQRLDAVNTALVTSKLKSIKISA